MARVTEFLGSMDWALENARWDTVGALAVRVTITAGDAVLAWAKGVRSADPDHRAALRLLRDAVPRKEVGGIKHFDAVITKKNLIEYEQRRSLTQREAEQLAEHARRFAAWAGKLMPEESSP